MNTNYDGYNMNELTSVIMTQGTVIAKCEQCLSLIRKVREKLWRERYEQSQTLHRFWRFKGSYEEFKARHDHIKSPDYYLSYEETAAVKLLRFARGADAATSIRVTMEDYNPVLKILEWAEQA